MKQHIFIVDQSVTENKFTKFTQNFEEFSPAKTIPSDINPYEKHGETGKREISDLLHDLIRITLRPSQIMGQFVFTIGPPPDRKYKFVWCSLGTFAAAIRLIGFFCQLEYYNLFNKQVIDRFGIVNANTTLNVTELILSLTTFISDFIGTFLFWKAGDDILSFFNRLNDFVILFAEDIKDSAWIQDWFRQTTKKTRRLVWVIHISSAITTLMMTHKDIYKIFLYCKGMPVLESDCFFWTFPLFAAAWFIVLFHRLHFRLWLMSTIDTLQLGFQIVKEQVRQFGKETEGAIHNLGNVQLVESDYANDDDDDNPVFSKEDSSKTKADNSMKNHLREIQLTQILEKYRTMEALLEEFNELFAPHLLIGIVSIVVVMLMALFHFFVDVNYQLSGTWSIFAIEAVVYTLVLFSMGTAATDMASEADACITTLRDVPLGLMTAGLKQKITLHFQHAMAIPLVVSPGYFFSLNRKMLTSVAGTLTTYLIVLIQFQTSEKLGSGSSGGQNSSMSTNS